MKLSSSGLEALIGGPCAVLAFDPPIEAIVSPPNVARVVIASYSKVSMWSSCNLKAVTRETIG